MEAVVVDAGTKLLKAGFSVPDQPPSIVIKIGKERYTVGESLFEPSILGLVAHGIVEQLVRCISTVPSENHLQLLENTVLCGGTVSMTSFEDRFQKEASLCSSAIRPSLVKGQVMTAVKEACKSAILQRKPRLVEGLYFCELNTPTEHLGSMYTVLARRRARLIKEEMQEGSSLFTVHAYVPVAESVGFADELRRWTSRASSALLVFSHWEKLPEDPFFVPKTEEEIEEFGDGSSVLQNTARKLIDAVRRRKGLPVEKKVFQHATKQRTLARKV